MNVRHGITGNYYIYSPIKVEVEAILRLIGKSVNSIYYNTKYSVYVARVKSKAHKKRIRKYLNDI